MRGVGGAGRDESDPGPGVTDRTRVPDPGRVRPFDFPEVVSAELDNGLALRTVRLGRLPVVSALLVLDAGEAGLSDERAGLAVLAGDALEGGTRGRDGGELAEALEGIGASMRISTGWDSVSVGLSCLADRMEEAVGLLAETVLEPAFPEEEVARFRSQRLAAIEERKTDPRRLADDQAVRFFFGPGIPYGRPKAGTAESVARLGREDVRGFAEAEHRPDRGGFVVVGDVELGEVEAMARSRFGGWHGRGDAAPDFDVEPRFHERRIILVNRPGAVQSEIRMGHPGVARTSDDYFPLLVLNTILGGAFTSRLNLNLREEHGFTYGARSRFHWRRSAGPFTVATAVGTEVTAAAVREALSELEQITTEGPTDEEVEQAKGYIAGVFPLRFETTRQIASRIGELIVYGLPDDHHATYRDHVRAVTTEDAAEAGRRSIHPDEMAVVVVGDAEKIRDPLEELGVAPVEVVEPDRHG